MSVIGIAKDVAGTAAKVPLIGIASLASGLAGLGIGAAVATKITQKVMQNKLENTRLTEEEIIRVNRWLYHYLTQTYGMSHVDAYRLMQNIAINEDAKNPIIKTPFIAIYNGWLNQVVLGHENEYSLLSQQQFKREMQPLIEYFQHAGLLEIDLDTQQLVFNQTKALSKSETLMVLYANTISALYLSLIESANQVPSTLEDYRQKAAIIREKIDKINIFKKEAYKEILETRNSFVAKVVKQMILRLPTRRQKALAPQQALIKDIEAQKDAAAAADVLEEERDFVESYEIGSDLRDDDGRQIIDPLEILAATAEADYQRKKFQIESSKLVTLAGKVATRSIQALGDISSTKLSKGRANKPAKMERRSKNTAPVVTQPDVTMVQQGIEHVSSHFRSSTEGHHQNVLLTDYAFSGFKTDKQRELLLKLPHSDLADADIYQAPGDLHRKTKISLKSRSGNYVDPKIAGAAAKELADITFLTKMNQRLAAAYNYEVGFGNGNDSPLAYILLKQQQFAVTALKDKYKHFLRSSLVRELIERFLHHYPEEELVTNTKTVPFGDATSVETKAINLVEHYLATGEVQHTSDRSSTPEAGHLRLTSVFEKLLMAKDSFLFADLRQALAGLAEQSNLVERILSEITIDPSLQVDVTSLPIDDPRQIAMETFAAVAADPNLPFVRAEASADAKTEPQYVNQPFVVNAAPLAIKKSLASWTKPSSQIGYADPIIDNPAQMHNEVSSQLSAEQQAIQEANKNFLHKTVVFSYMLKAGSHFIHVLNKMDWQGRKKTLAKLQAIANNSLYIDFDPRSQQFTFKEYMFANTYHFHQYFNTLTALNNELTLINEKAQMKAYASYAQHLNTDLQLSDKDMLTLSQKQKDYLEHASAKAQQEMLALTQQLAAVKDAKALAEERYQQLQDQVADKQERTLERLKELEVAAADNTTLMQQVADVESQLQQAQEKAKTAQSNLQTTTAEYNDSKAKVIKHSKKAIEHIKKLHQSLVDEVKLKQERVAALEVMTTQVSIADEKKVQNIRADIQEVLANQLQAMLNTELNYDAEPIASYLANHSEDHDLPVNELFANIAMERMDNALVGLKEDTQQKIKFIKDEITSLEKEIVAKQKQISANEEVLQELYKEQKDLHIQGDAITNKLNDSSDVIDALRAQLSALQKELLSLKTDQEAIKADVKARFAEMTKFIDERFAELKHDDTTTVSMKDGDDLPSIGVSRRIRIHDIDKGDALKHRVDVVEFYLKRLRFKAGQDGLSIPKMIGKTIKQDAFNAMLAAFYVAQIHRNRFGSPNNTASSVAMAQHLLPSNMKQRVAFLSYLKNQLARIEQKYSAMCTTKDIDGINPNSLKLLRSANTKRVAKAMTPAKLARIFKDIVRLQYAVNNSGQQACFLSRDIPDLEWATQYKALFGNDEALQDKFDAEKLGLTGNEQQLSLSNNVVKAEQVQPPQRSSHNSPSM